MIIQDEFKNNGYINLLEGKNAQNNAIELDDLFDLDQKPEELLGIFLSEPKDELFFLLNADVCDINQMCDKWDNLIRGFIIINSNSEDVRKYKFNIIQLIIHSSDNVDKNRETNLLISRKIIIKGDMTDLNQIYIEDFDAIELPFHMILPDSFSRDKEIEKKLKEKKLKELIPSDKKLLSLLEKENKKAFRKNKKSFGKDDYDMIKEWLEA